MRVCGQELILKIWQRMSKNNKELIWRARRKGVGLDLSLMGSLGFIYTGDDSMYPFMVKQPEIRPKQSVCLPDALDLLSQMPKFILCLGPQLFTTSGVYRNSQAAEET